MGRLVSDAVVIMAVSVAVDVTVGVWLTTTV
jgi:hypothetical protein